jgi:hypothetical protein
MRGVEVLGKIGWVGCVCPNAELIANVSVATYATNLLIATSLQPEPT